MPHPAARHAARLALLVPLVVGCAPAGEVTRDPGDPLEAQNRRVHAFNKQVDRVALRPASQVYGRGVPDPVRQGVANFVGNLSGPSYVLNDVLQGEIEDAGHNFFRFALNTTLGVGGIFDPATSFGLEERESDFGQTLAVHGVAEGPFLSLPFYGPTTSREVVGEVVDFALNPLDSWGLPDDVEAAVLPARAGELLDDRYRYTTAIDQALYDSADSYAQTRELYLQMRRYEVGGAQSEDYFDPYADLYDE